MDKRPCLNDYHARNTILKSQAAARRRMTEGEGE